VSAGVVVGVSVGSVVAVGKAAQTMAMQFDHCPSDACACMYQVTPTFPLVWMANVPSPCG
jgi:hypothetical protein